MPIVSRLMGSFDMKKWALVAALVALALPVAAQEVDIKSVGYCKKTLTTVLETGAWGNSVAVYESGLPCTKDAILALLLPTFCKSTHLTYLKYQIAMLDLAPQHESFAYHVQHTYKQFVATQCQ